jgi:beta-phosphoglucomutase
MKSVPKAFIFDLNGTMIDDMHYHTEAWHRILTSELGASLSLEEVKGHMYGKNIELLVRIFGEDYFSPEEAERISVEKERHYQQAFLPHLKLIRGLDQFLEQARQQDIAMAIGSAAITFNIDFVLDNLGIRHYFKAIVSADDVSKSKPDPETFSRGAELMGVQPADCIVFEDAPKGVEAAQRAGMDCVVLTTMHSREEFASYPNIIGFIEDYTHPSLEHLLLAAPSGK